MIEGKEYFVFEGVPLTGWTGPGNSRLHLVHTMYEWKHLHAQMMKQKLVACDTETTGLRWYRDRIVGMSFGWGLDHFYVPVRHEASRSHPDILPQLNMEDLVDDLKAFFGRSDLTTIWANCKFDWHMYLNEGIECYNTVFHDVITGWKFYDENSPGGLKEISTGWRDTLGNYVPGVVGKDANIFEKEIRDWRVAETVIRKKHYREQLKSMVDAMEKMPQYQGVKRIPLRKIAAESPLLNNRDRDVKLEEIHYGLIPIEMMARYAALDTYLTWQVYNHIMKNVKFDKQKLKLYVNEHKLSKVLFDAERRGVHVDMKTLQDAAPKYNALVAEREQALRFVLPEGYRDINIRSNDQIAAAMVAAGVDLGEPNEDGKYSVNRKALNKVASHPVVKGLLEFRQFAKMVDTYIIGLQDFVTPEGKVHGSFNQNVRTGRMSCQAPSLLNIPRKDDTIRNAFVCPKDYVMVIPDFSQIEVRLLAHESKDPLLLDTYAKGQDVHTRTMCEVFGHNVDEVTGILEDEDHPRHKELSLLRSATKTIVFGIIYGISSFGLAEQIKRPEKYADLSQDDWQRVCEDYIRAYFDKYLYVKRFVNSTIRELRADGQVTNAYGRVRHLPYVNAYKLTRDPKTRRFESRAERQAVNFKIQGMAADMFKEVVVRVHETLKGTQSALVNVIHDEIWFYVHRDDLDVVPKLKHNMEDFNLSVPIVAEFSYSTTSWANKLKGFPPPGLVIA